MKCQQCHGVGGNQADVCHHCGGSGEEPSMREQLDQAYDNLMYADGHDNAILGVTRTDDGIVVVYSVYEILCNFVAMGMTREDAVEYYDYNVKQAYMGPQTPIYVEQPR